MKKSIKILVILLSLSLMISGFAVFAYADDSEIVEPYNYEAVLEYYEAGYYLNATFDDAPTLNEAIADSSEDFSVSGKVAYTANENGTATMKSISPVYFDVITGESTSFGVSAKLSLDTATSSISLRLNTVKRSSAVNEVLKIFEISNGTIKVYSASENSIPTYSSTEFNIATGEMFELKLFYNKVGSAETVTVDITSENSEPINLTFDTDGFAFKAFDISSTYVTMDYCEIYRGSFPRKLSNNTADIAALLNENVDKYNENPENALAFNYLETVAKVVVTYGFDDSSVHEKAKIAVEKVAQAYAESYLDIVKLINPSMAYHESVSLISSIEPYGVFLETLKNIETYSSVEVDYDAIFAAKAIVDAEIERLAKAKADTIYSYDVVLSIANLYSASYGELKEVIDEIKEHPICETYSDEEHTSDEISLAARYAKAISSEFEKKDNMATVFVTQVPIMCDESLPFADRYAAYTLAKNNKFTDESYDAYLEDTTIAELLESYEISQADMKEASDYAEEFLLKVKEAYLTSSYAVKSVALDSAELYIENVERGYPGVEESIELYYALREDIENKINAAKQYINAVLAVQTAETVEEKKAAIEVANAYAVSGSDVSVEVTDMEITVTEANIILSIEESNIRLIETSISSYVAAVNSISQKASISEKYSAINKALELQASIDASAAGVSEANVILEAEIAAYNAEIEAANAKCANCNELALQTLSGTAPTKSIAQIAAIIKKFFE